MNNNPKVHCSRVWSCAQCEHTALCRVRTTHCHAHGCALSRTLGARSVATPPSQPQALLRHGAVQTLSRQGKLCHNRENSVATRALEKPVTTELLCGALSALLRTGRSPVATPPARSALSRHPTSSPCRDTKLSVATQDEPSMSRQSTQGGQLRQAVLGTPTRAQVLLSYAQARLPCTP